MSAAPYYVVCPRCGSPDVAIDATARWNFEAQDWSLSSTFDDRTCQTCLHEGDSFDQATEAELTETQRAYIFDGADYPPPENDR